MAAKDELKEIRKIDVLINTKLDELQTAKTLAEKVTTTYSDMPRGGNISDKVCDNVVKIVMLQHEINAHIDDLVDRKHEAIRKISMINEVDRRVVLSLRYLANKSWEEIADKLDKTIQWVHVLHGRALQDYDNIK